MSTQDIVLIRNIS